MPSMYLTWLVRDRQRFGLTPAQAAGLQEYFELEAGKRCPSSAVWERMVALYGWPV